MATISEILMAQGRHAAESRRARAGAWQPFMQYAANLPNQIMADRQAERAGQEAAFDRQQQRDVRGQQLAKGEQELAAQTRGDEDDQALAAIFSSPGILDETGTVDLRKAVSLAQQQAPRLVPRLMEAAQKHDEGVQQAALRAAQTAAAERSNQPQPTKLEAFDPTRDLRDPVTGELKVKGTAAPEEEVSMVIKGPNGRPVRVMVPKSQLRNGGVEEYREPQMSPQERSGYFTMTPIYDAQGRPIGAMKLNARTGETTLVKPEDMGGGVTARPPGNLGQRTVENEAALDSLGRLKDMFDKGAKADIGPAEGRARSIGQRVPGGAFVTERFANFEAATRAFQNAMIKAITGAQMSEPEAQRIMAQIPNVNDNPTVWQAKYAQSVKNLEDLENRTRTDRGGGAGDQTDALLDELLGGGR